MAKILKSALLRKLLQSFAGIPSLATTAFASFGLALSMSSTANADIVIPVGTYSASLVAGDKSDYESGAITGQVLFFSLGSNPPGVGITRVTTNGFIDPATSVTINNTSVRATVPFLTTSSLVTNPGSFASATTNLSLTYYFTVLGPPGVSVPLDIYIQGSLSGEGESEGVTGWTIQGVISGLISQHGIATDLGTAELIMAGNGQTTTLNTFPKPPSVVSVMSNEIDVIQMSASSYASLQPQPDESGVAFTSWIDPYITIDPTFADADQFSIAVSPFIGKLLNLTQLQHQNPLRPQYS